jgi:hypothetical protein
MEDVMCTDEITRLAVEFAALVQARQGWAYPDHDGAISALA